MGLRKEKSPLISMRFLESAPGLNQNKLIYISSNLSLIYILLDFFKVKGAQVKLPYYVIMRKIFSFRSKENPAKFTIFSNACVFKDLIRLYSRYFYKVIIIYTPTICSYFHVFNKLLYH